MTWTREPDHIRHVGDTITVLPVTLQQRDATGTLAAKNLTGLTVQFKMLNAADDSTKVTLSATGVSVVSAAAGTVNKTFLAADVNTAGLYWAYFVVISGAATDHFPVDRGRFLVQIDSDTQSGVEAYEAAVG